MSINLLRGLIFDSINKYSYAHPMIAKLIEDYPQYLDWKKLIRNSQFKRYYHIVLDLIDCGN
jgi:hypothetical protein